MIKYQYICDFCKKQAQGTSYYDITERTINEMYNAYGRFMPLTDGIQYIMSQLCCKECYLKAFNILKLQNADK